MAKMNPSKLRNVLEALPFCDLSNTKKEAIEAIITKYLEGDIVPVVHGRWVEKAIVLEWCEDDVDIFYACSACGAASPCETFYCPNCGAKMDRKKEGDSDDL